MEADRRRTAVLEPRSGAGASTAAAARARESRVERDGEKDGCGTLVSNLMVKILYALRLTPLTF